MLLIYSFFNILPNYVAFDVPRNAIATPPASNSRTAVLTSSNKTIALT